MQRLGFGVLRHAIQIWIRVLTTITRKVVPKHVLQLLVEPSAEARLGTVAADGHGAGDRRSTIVLWKTHGVFSGIAANGSEAGRQLGDIVVVRVVEEAVGPNAVGHVDTTIGARCPRWVGVCARCGRRIA